MQVPSREETRESFATYYAQQIKVIQENRPAIDEYMKLNADLAWQRYSMLRTAGFTEEQAMRVLLETRT